MPARATTSESTKKPIHFLLHPDNENYLQHLFADGSCLVNASASHYHLNSEPVDVTGILRRGMSLRVDRDAPRQ